MLIDRGAIHVSHADERFRGVWIPLASADGDEEFEADVPVHDADGKPVIDKETEKPVTRRMVVKRAAKKTAKKAAKKAIKRAIVKKAVKKAVKRAIIKKAIAKKLG